MSRPPSPLFLERESYRRRRLMDAARILPVAGLVLFLLPALWMRSEAPNTAGEAVYLFAVWAALIVAAGLIARPLRRADAARAPRAPAPRGDVPSADPQAQAPTGAAARRPAVPTDPGARAP
jgi:hypothetical protein